MSRRKHPSDELDSLATWPTEDGKTWLIATGKSSHRLVVFDADTGEQLRTVGSEGKARASSSAPTASRCMATTCSWSNATTIACRCWRCPTSRSSARFGEKELRSPYGIWLTEKEPGELEVYITDSFMYGKKFDVVPPFDELDQRVRRYRVSFDQDGGLRAQYAGAFGDTREDSALRMVESIAGDPANDRMLIADEDRRHLSTLREYSFSGRYTGRTLPQDASAPKPRAWPCGPARTAAVTGSPSTSSRR